MFRTISSAVIELTLLFVSTTPVCPAQLRAQAGETSGNGVVTSSKVDKGARGEISRDLSGIRVDQEVGQAGDQYLDPIQGSSADELVRLAIASNFELATVRLDVDRARARARQAGLIPNPTVEFEQGTGKFTGSPGERESNLSFAMPLELFGQRRTRIELARVELEIAEALVAERERMLAIEVRKAYVEALTGLRELEVADALRGVDLETARIIEARVSEGESAPLELNLLRAEAERLKSRRAMIEGRVQASLLRLKSLAGLPADSPLRLRDDLAASLWRRLPSSLEGAISLAMQLRSDLRLARLNEKAAEAGLAVARANAATEVTAFTRYSTNRTIFDSTPIGPLRDTDHSLVFGMLVSLPLFNRNQGGKAEAAVAMAQARKRREFGEQLIRSEVMSAYARFAASDSAVSIFHNGVLARSAQNVESIRGAYQLGAFRVTELLSEQRRLLDSQREYTEALAERFRALSDLMSAVGAPLDSIEK